jgi:hypothetical protein
MICKYLNIDTEAFLYKRENGDETIIQSLDPVQFMIPEPKKSKTIEAMEKELTTQLLQSLMQSTVTKIKDNQDDVKVKRSEFQGLYHFVMEDMLWTEYKVDFEDFKSTVMHHGILSEDNYKVAMQIEEDYQELLKFFETRFLPE